MIEMSVPWTTAYAVTASKHFYDFGALNIPEGRFQCGYTAIRNCLSQIGKGTMLKFFREYIGFDSRPFGTSIIDIISFCQILEECGGISMTYGFAGQNFVFSRPEVNYDLWHVVFHMHSTADSADMELFDTIKFNRVGASDRDMQNFYVVLDEICKSDDRSLGSFLKRRLVQTGIFCNTTRDFDQSPNITNEDIRGDIGLK